MAGCGGVGESVYELEQEITCAICQDHYTDPKVLPCCHYYCKSCIQLLVRSAGGSHKPFSCPECRAETTLPQDGGLDSLQTAFFINRMQQVHSKLEQAHSKASSSLKIEEEVAGKCSLQVESPSCSAQVQSTSFTSSSPALVGSTSSTLSSLQTCRLHCKPMNIRCFDCCCYICRDCALEAHCDHRQALQAMSSPRPGRSGYIYHLASGILVHPSGGSAKPRNDTKLVVYRSYRDAEKRLQVRFVPVKGAGHFGYIEHVSSGKVVHPRRGKPNPSNDTSLVFHSDRHAGALFAFDEQNKRIVHHGGKIWHPKGGRMSPSNDTTCVLHSDVHNAAKFYFGDITGRPISPYSEDLALNGDWKIVKAVKPSAEPFVHKCTYKIGKSANLSTSSVWNMDSRDVRTLFEVEDQFRSFVERADSRTWWSGEKEVTKEFMVNSEMVVVWQYVFFVSQYNESCVYRSSIISETDSIDKKPAS